MTKWPHLVILRTLLSKATYNWGIHKAIHPKEADRHRKCSQYQVSGIVPNNYKLESEGINKESFFFMMKSNSVERDEFSAVAWKLSGNQHSGLGWEDRSTSQEQWTRMI